MKHITKTAILPTQKLVPSHHSIHWSARLFSSPPSCNSGSFLLISGRWTVPSPTRLVSVFLGSVRIHSYSVSPSTSKLHVWTSTLLGASFLVWFLILVQFSSLHFFTPLYTVSPLRKARNRTRRIRTRISGKMRLSWTPIKLPRRLTGIIIKDIS